MECIANKYFCCSYKRSVTREPDYNHNSWWHVTGNLYRKPHRQECQWLCEFLFLIRDNSKLNPNFNRRLTSSSSLCGLGSDNQFNRTYCQQHIHGELFDKCSSSNTGDGSSCQYGRSNELHFSKPHSSQQRTDLTHNRP